MSKFIFKNSSYIIVYNIPYEVITTLSSLFKQKGLRVAIVEDIEGLKDAFDSINYYCGTFISCTSQEEYDQINSVINSETGIQYISSETNIVVPDSSKILLPSSIEVQDLEKLTNDLLADLIPKRMDELSKFSANFIFPSLFPQFSLGFDDANIIEINDFTHQIICDVSGDVFKGRAWVKVNLNKLRKMHSDFETMREDLLIDNCREFVNQYLGVVNTNMMSLGYSPSVGLPSVYSKQDCESIQLSGPHIPVVSLKDENSIFHVRLGIVLLDGKCKLDMSELQIKEPDSEIDFF